MFTKRDPHKSTVHEIKQWALSQPLSATYIINKKKKEDWKLGPGPLQPDIIMHLINVALGRKPVLISGIGKHLFASFFKKVMDSDVQAQKELVMFMNFKSRTPEDLKKLHIEMDSDEGADIGPWTGLYMFRKDIPINSKYASILMITHTNNKYYKIVMNRYKIKNDMILGIIIGICLGYDKIDILANYSSTDIYNDANKREERIKSFEKEWKDANYKLENLLQDNLVEKNREFMLRESKNVYDFINKYNKKSNKLVDEILEKGDIDGMDISQTNTKKSGSKIVAEIKSKSK